MSTKIELQKAKKWRGHLALTDLHRGDGSPDPAPFLREAVGSGDPTAQLFITSAVSSAGYTSLPMFPGGRSRCRW
jgi:hypothetical protein